MGELILLTAETIQELKRTNISVSPDKTKQRVEEFMRPAMIAQKKAIRELAGVSPQVTHSIYASGKISIKMVIAISQTLNLDPFYLTGQSDEPGEYSDAALRELLLKHGYRALVASLELAEAKPKRPYTRRKKPEQEVPSESNVQQGKKDAEALLPLAAVLSEEDQQALLRALHVRCKAGIVGAKERLDKINQLLIG